MIQFALGKLLTCCGLTTWGSHQLLTDVLFMFRTC